MAASEVLSGLNDNSRSIWLYDTFEGLPEPDTIDTSVLNQSGIKLWSDRKKNNESNWCRVEIEDVKNNINLTSYPKEKFIFVKGKVEDTIPEKIPESISILRLDLDWYSPTIHTLKYLFPKLSKGGFLIIDDYGHWNGTKLAVDEYFEKLNFSPYLFPIDYSCRMFQKI
jgi:O-methyltransferase